MRASSLILIAVLVLCSWGISLGQTLSVSLPDTVLESGEQITVSLKFSGLTSADPDSGAFGFLVRVTYDPSVLTPVSAVCTVPGFTNQSNPSFSATQVVLAGTEPGGEIIALLDGTIATVTFTVVGAAGQESPLTIVPASDMFSIGKIGEYDLLDVSADIIKDGSVTVAGSQPEQGLSVSLPDTVVDSGEQITVPLKFSGLTSADPDSGAFGFLVKVIYDPSVLSPVSAACTVPGFTNQSNPSFSATQVVLAGTEPGGEIIALHDGTIATVTFTVVGIAGQESPLTIVPASDMFSIGKIGEYDLADVGADSIHSGSVTVTGVPPAIVSIDIQPDSVSLGVGGTHQFTATATYTFGPDSVVTGRASWSSSDTLVATINSSGLATTKSIGEATIRATYREKEDTAKLIVEGELPVRVLSVSMPDTNADSGEQITVPLRFGGLTSVNPDSGAFGFLVKVTYDPSVLTPVSATCTVPGFTNQSNVNLSATQVALAGTEPGGEIIALYDGVIATVTFTVIGTFGQMSPLTITSASDMFSIGKIGEYDLADVGADSIHSGSVTVTGVPPAIVSIDIQPDSVSLGVGGTHQFTATATYTFGPDSVVTGRALWSSSDTLVATINSSGLATAKSIGETTIRATYRGKEDTAKLIVVEGGLVKVKLPQMSVQPGQIVLIPVDIDTDASDRITVSSCEVVVTYDSDVVRMHEPSIMGTLVDGWSVEYRIAQGVDVSIDTFRVALATSADTIASGTLFYIRAIASEYASSGDSCGLIFERCEFDEGGVSVETENGSMRIVFMLGDVSGNGRVSAYDASLILQQTVGLIILPDPRWSAFTLATADVTGNGSISALDASKILQYIVGIITRFPAEGDAGKLVYAEKQVRVGEPDRSSDHRWVVPIEIDEMDGVLAGEMELSFDGADVVEVRMVDLISEYLSAVNIEKDRIRLSFAGAQSRSGEGRIIEVVLEGSPVLSIDWVSLNEGRIPVRVVQGELESPRTYSLSQNYPNPFNPETTITYDMAESGVVRLAVYALTGQHIRTLVDGECVAGRYSVLWDGSDGTGKAVGSGVYVCRMVVGDYSAVKKMLLVR